MSRHDGEMIVRGATRTWVVPIVDRTTLQPINLTGATGQYRIAKKAGGVTYTYAADLNIDAAHSEVSVVLPPGVTQGLEVGPYWHEFWLTDIAGARDRVSEGWVNVIDSIPT
jgi:hypothetical protein